MEIIIHLVWNPYFSPIILPINSGLIGESNNLFSVSLLFSPGQVLPCVHLHLESRWGVIRNSSSFFEEVTNIRNCIIQATKIFH